ncbi:hypothetical protein [Pseudoalteromonas sp.]|uniref:hypothetical protein n=1 Tax=Pseudoalteromonas TaxID=53246 RepID=UPI003F98B08A
MGNLNVNMISHNKFKVVKRGHEFTIERQASGIWWVTVLNASVRAYSNGVAFPKEFDTIEAIEKQYKSLNGLSALLKASSEDTVH